MKHKTVNGLDEFGGWDEMKWLSFTFRMWTLEVPNTQNKYCLKLPRCMQVPDNNMFLLMFPVSSKIS